MIKVQLNKNKKYVKLSIIISFLNHPEIQKIYFVDEFSKDYLQNIDLNILQIKKEKLEKLFNQSIQLSKNSCSSINETTTRDLEVKEFTIKNL